MLTDMDELFCERCGTIWPVVERAPCVVTCALCKLQKRIEADNDRVVDVQQRSYVKTVADTLLSDDAVANQDDVIQVEHACTKCGYQLASYTTQQTRSADEGQTVFYTCLQCKHRCIEYS